MTEKCFGKELLADVHPEEFWIKAQYWSATFDHFMIFDHNDVSYPFGAFPKMIMAGARRILDTPVGGTFSYLKKDRTLHSSWLGGYFGYDLKNETEALVSLHDDFCEFPDSCFFEPETVLRFYNDKLEIFYLGNPDDVLRDILACDTDRSAKNGIAKLVRSPDKPTYLRNIDQIRQHIIDGDMYEMNYCVDFGLENVSSDPLLLYFELKKRSPTPFSTLGRFDDHYLICASPERFIRKNGDELLSQPIKGTAPRGRDAGEDDSLRAALKSSEKERAENMMIVDLVRNDLTRSAVTGTIRVPEIFGIYTFEHLHQMISSVTAQLKPDCDPVDAIRNAFPMGSMTGAPKVKVMELIEAYESGKRGIYSGAAGFFTPGNDFDFNVVIRSMAYNKRTKRLGFWVGGAITFDSVAEEEYRECLLKARAILEVLSKTEVLDTRIYLEKN